MDSIIKKYADNGETEHLRYIFLDSLDVDPTFENYKEEFEYCRNIPGLFEPYRELSPLKNDPSQWNDTYWISVKKDLKKNYSLERFEHMKDVAKVVYADKVERLKKERQERKEEEIRKQKESEELASAVQVINTHTNTDHYAKVSKAEPKVNVKNNTEENQKYGDPQYSVTQQEREKKANETKERLDKALEEKNNREKDAYAKKALGTAALIAVIIIAAIVILTVK